MSNQEVSATTEKPNFTCTAFFSPVEQHLHTALAAEAKVVTVGECLRVIVCDENCEQIPRGAINLSQMAQDLSCPRIQVGKALDRFELNNHIEQVSEGDAAEVGRRIFKVLYSPFLVEERSLYDNQQVTLPVLKGFGRGHDETEPAQKLKDQKTSPTAIKPSDVPIGWRVFLTHEEAQTLLTCAKTKVFVNSAEGRAVADLLEKKPLIGALSFRYQRFLVVTPHEETEQRFYEIKPDVAARCVFLLQNGRGNGRSVTKARHTRQPVDRWFKCLEELAAKTEKSVPNLQVAVELKPHEEEKNVRLKETESRQITTVEILSDEVPIYLVEISPDEAKKILCYVSEQLSCSTRDFFPNRLARPLVKYGFFTVTKIGRRVRVLVDREKAAFFRFVERDLRHVHNKPRLSEIKGQPDAGQWLRDLETIKTKKDQQSKSNEDPEEIVEEEISDIEEAEEAEEETELRNADDLSDADLNERITQVEQVLVGIEVELRAMKSERERRRELKRQKLAQQKIAADELRRRLAEVEAEAQQLEAELDGLN